MADLETQPKMVGREEELKQLKTFLNRAREGHGNTVFIAGEAGVGKTRLLEELKGYAREQGVDVLQGWSLYESLTPYMPFLEALRSGGLENLFADEAPRVEAVYLVSHSGMSIKEVIRKETKLDPDIFSGMLTAVGDFVQDSLSMLTGEDEKGTLNTLGFKNYRIIIENLGNLYLAIILTGRENEFLVNDIKEVLVNVDQKCGDTLKEWDGNGKEVEGLDSILEKLITSGKYDGIDYTKDSPEIKRNRLFENILLGFERHTKINPTLLCIEDLHWADTSSLALMHYIARNSRKCNLLILGTYRPEDISITIDDKVHQLVETMQMMNREDLFQKIELKRLKKKHMDEILTLFFEKSDFPNDFSIHLYKETEGNPFFIKSLIRMLIEEGTIVYKDDTWTLIKELKEANIPSKIYDVVIRRLYRVKEKQKEILEYAAVMGEEFSSDILSSTTGLNKIKILRELRTLEQNHKLIRSIEPKYKFDHAKYKEVISSQIPADLKKEYHTAIAESIETLYKEHHDEVMGDLAYHYYNGANKKKALPYLIKLGEKAKNEYSNQEGINYFTQALELEMDEQKKCMVVESLGDIFFAIGNYEKSQELHEKALTLNLEMKKKAGLLAKIGFSYEMNGKYNDVLEINLNALEIVKNEECKEKALILRQIGFIYSRFGNYNKAFENLKKSLEISNKIDDQTGISATFLIMGLLYEGQDEFEKAIEITTKSLGIQEKIGNLRGISACIFNIGFYYTRLGKYEKALECHLSNIPRFKKTGDPIQESYTYWDLAEIYYREEDMRKSLYYTNQAFNLSNRIGFEEVIAAAHRLYGMNYGHQGNWDESIENFNNSIELFDEMGFKVEMRRSYLDYGLMWKAKGDLKKAKECFDKADQILEEIKSGECMENLRKVLLKY